MPAKTPNQIVAYNLARIRDEKGWNQDEVVTRLADYGVSITRANYSLMETSWKREDRIRNFDADLIAALAAVFEVPVLWFYLPPDDDEFTYTVGHDLTLEEWLDLAWPLVDIRKAADPVEGAFTRRLLDLSKVANQDAIEVMQQSIQPQVAQAVANAMPTVLQLAKAIEAEYERAQFWLESLRSYLSSDVTDPVWKEALHAFATEGEEE